MLRAWLASACLALGALSVVFADDLPRLAPERVVISTTFGDVQVGFFPDVAPLTVKHIIKLFQLGCYNSNHFFRVHAGFVAQTSDVASGRMVHLSDEQKKEAEVKVPLEVVSGVKHAEGVLSMARSSDPNSGGSSFSILLGDSPHLDMQYTVFGKVLRGMENMHKMESVPTKKEGIFVMPLDRITIFSTFVVYFADPQDTVGTAWSLRQVETEIRENDGCQEVKERAESLALELQRTREKCLPN
eukprot:jgi/Ulvmu1/1831/UM119_0050.1